jgi:hypothetical protein
MKELILDYVDDLVSDFLYYDRKDDEQLRRGDIENAIESGEISIDDIVNKFRECLER